MASKTLFLLALLLASAVLLATAADQTHDKDEKKGAGVQDWRGGGGYPGHGGGGYPGHGGGYPGHGGGYPGHGGGCRCCGHGYHGGCRCCATAEEIPEPMYRPEVQN